MEKLYKDMNTLERKKLYLQSTYVRSLEGLHKNKFHESIVKSECIRAKELIERYNLDTFIDKKGIIRWKSNSNVPPTEILLLWKYSGKRFDLDKAIYGREKDFEKVVKSAKDFESNMSKEMKEERERNLRGAFGSGQNIVNVVTGKKYRT